MSRRSAEKRREGKIIEGKIMGERRCGGIEDEAENDDEEEETMPVLRPHPYLVALSGKGARIFVSQGVCVR
jgi:hypothetical protein